MPSIRICLNPTELRQAIIDGLRFQRLIPDNAKVSTEDVSVNQITTGYQETGRDYTCQVSIPAQNEA